MTIKRTISPLRRNKKAIQPGENISSNTVFLACNFNNKRVKRHFDALKKELEHTLPIRVYMSDQVQAGGARDLWKDISMHIEEANLAVFDVTSFRPNVVLELGYSLAKKETERIIICRDLTPSGKKGKRHERWLLSDIPHLNRFEYKLFKKLDARVMVHVNKMAPVVGFYRLMKDIERRPKLVPHRYITVARDLLRLLRDEGPMRRREFREYLKDNDVDEKLVQGLFKKYELAKPDSGKNGVWRLID